MKKSILFSMLAFLLAAVPGQAATTAYVTIAPQKYFVDRVSGGTVPVAVMVKAGSNPHAYEPRRSQMAELAKTTVYFTIGDSFDQIWLPRIVDVSTGITVVHTEAGVTKLPMTDHDHDEAEEAAHAKGQDHNKHQDHEDHDHGTLDPHIWLDPARVKIQVQNIRDGLSKVDPANAQLYATNAATFLAEIDTLDQDIRLILAPLPENQRQFLVFHPSWGYFAHTYGLEQLSIEVDGKEPSAREMATIVATGRDKHVRVIFVQPQFSEKSATVIAQQIGARIVRLDPLAENWADNMRTAARAFAQALQ